MGVPTLMKNPPSPLGRSAQAYFTEIVKCAEDADCFSSGECKRKLLGHIDEVHSAFERLLFDGGREF